MAENTSDRSGVPTGVAILIVLIAAGAGGWILWRYWIAPPVIGDTITVAPPSPQQLQQQRGIDVGPDNPRIRNFRNRWTAYGNSLLFIVIRNDAGDESFEYRYSLDAVPRGSDFVWDHRRYLINDGKEKLHLSDEQLDKLRPLCLQLVPAPVSADQQAQIESAWGALLDAQGNPAKTAAQKALIDKVEAAGQTVADQASHLTAQRAAQISDVLTPEQLRAFQAVYEPAAKLKPAPKPPQHDVTTAPTLPSPVPATGPTR